ncbi:hypothetical protein [Runella salmonicolor]|uniref:Uncharacterized protein n=1 Tax=Runella salmonicolor TaxID=2950278 RepID=A0ABT1FNC3_9BACT|nr:hypothetical protein [Runella salmonicolor]MCP1383000.1 hypothetical protein [Runella salmonicolor]
MRFLPEIPARPEYGTILFSTWEVLLKTVPPNVKKPVFIELRRRSKR